MGNFHIHHRHDKHVHDDINISNHDKCKKHHDYKSLKDSNKKILTIIMVVTMVFATVEFLGGIWSGSLTLISDSFHMITDSAAILLALVMASISQKPANNKYSYGHGRAEVIGALFNGLFMIGVIAYLIYEGINRIITPQPIQSIALILIASGGLLVNLFAIYMLKDSHSLNTKAALIHVIGDLLGSIAAIAAGIIIYFTGMTIFDPIISLIVSAILIYPTYNILKQSFHILMDGVPLHINYEDVGLEIDGIDGVISTHDLHIWTMTSEHVSLSAHVQIKSMTEWDSILSNIQLMLAEKFGITHVTLQPEIIKP